MRRLFIITLLSLLCVVAARAQSVITLTRVDGAQDRAVLCAPAGAVWERRGAAYRLAFEAWQGGCAEITVSGWLGGDVYCVQTSPSPPTFVCTDPLPRTWRTRVILPLIAR